MVSRTISLAMQARSYTICDARKPRKETKRRSEATTSHCLTMSVPECGLTPVVNSGTISTGEHKICDVLACTFPYKLYRE